MGEAGKWKWSCTKTLYLVHNVRICAVAVRALLERVFSVVLARAASDRDV